MSASRRSMSGTGRISSTLPARAASRERGTGGGVANAGRRSGNPPPGGAGGGGGSMSAGGEYPGPAMVAAPRPDSAGIGPQFWRSKFPGTKLLCGPLGREIGEVEAGIVVEEASHFYDYFGGLWVAANAGDDTMLWFNPREPHAESETGESCWEFVVETADEGGSGAGKPDQGGVPPIPTAPSRGRRGSGTITVVNQGGLGAVVASAQRPQARPSPPRARSTNSNPLQYSFENFNNDAMMYAEFYETVRGCKALEPTAGASAAEVNGSGAENVRDWNEEYQCLIEQLVYGSSSSSENGGETKKNNKKKKSIDELRAELEALAADFVDEVDNVVTAIVQEISTPNSKRTVPSYTKAPNNTIGVYFRGGIYYRVCLDTAGAAYAGDANAQKVASTLHKTHELVGSYAPLHGLSCPLMVVMTFCGHRILASTIPPIQRHSESVVLGPRGDPTPTTSASGAAAAAGGGGRGPDGAGGKVTPPPVGGNRIANEVPVIRRMVDALGEQLNLKSHTVSGETTTKFPAETTVHAGMDGRLYILNIGRTLPPLAPPPQHPPNTTAQASAPYFPPTTSLFRRLRPEAAIALTTPCNPDAFVPGATTQHDNADVQRFTQWLRDDTIPVVAATLGFLEPLPVIDYGASPFDGSDAKRPCVGCDEDISDDTLRFLACASCDCKGCYLCPQCVVNFHQEHRTLEEEVTTTEEKAEGGAAEEGEEEQQHHEEGDPTAKMDIKVAGLLRCSSVESRGLKGLMMQPDVTALFHSHGLNMRFLSYVHAAIPISAKRCTARYLEVEMIARAAKHLLNAALRRTQDDEEVRIVCINFFLALLQPEGSVAEAFWSEQLGPMIQSHFEVFSAFDTSSLDMELCYRRVAELTGVELTEDSIKSFKTPEPFVQLLRPHPVMKWMHLPRITEEGGGGAGGGATTTSFPGVPLKTLYQDELVEFWRGRKDSESASSGVVLWPEGRLPAHMTTI